MKISNINDASEYPVDYDFLPQTDKDIILNYFKYQQELADGYYEKHCMEGYERDTMLRLYDHVVDIMCGAKEILAYLGIMVEYSWPHAPGEWAFATRQDALDRESNDSYYNGSCDNTESTAGRDAWPTPQTK